MSEVPAVEVAVRIAAAPETVFPYFTDPARYVQWMGRDAGLPPGSTRVLVMPRHPGRWRRTRPGPAQLTQRIGHTADERQGLSGLGCY
jgi:uncharacterized protein YndB with AHSA1/START domain